MIPQEIRNKRVLLSSLNWGYGHLSRCISIVSILIQNKNTVFFAGREADFITLRQYFSEEITYIPNEPYPFTFRGGRFRKRDFVKSLIPLLNCYKREVKSVPLLVDEFNIDLVLSDHRYGFRSDKCPSIFITHQCTLPLKKMAWPIQWLHQSFIRKFSEVWIIDDQEKRFAGKLSESLGKRATYIGIHSRFNATSYAPEEIKKEIECVLLISGPLEFSLALITHFKKEFNEMKGPKYIIGSKEIIPMLPAHLSEYFKPNNNWKETDELLLQTKLVMSYSGYSTIMDIQFLQCEAKLIPTKGQFEQVYLAARLSKTKKALINDQGFSK
jgi:hypothetical protein